MTWNDSFTMSSDLYIETPSKKYRKITEEIHLYASVYNLNGTFLLTDVMEVEDMFFEEEDLATSRYFLFYTRTVSCICSKILD